jgi:sugar O-acyltransferase (sialic acid O-acetyltransferase NeuD family)
MDNHKYFAIWGSAGHAKVLSSLLSMMGKKVVVLFDNSDVPSSIPGVPIYIGEAGFLNWKKQFGDVTGVAALVAIGGRRGKDRIAIQHYLSEQGLQFPWVGHPSASICCTARIGAGTQVLAQALVAADACLGEACIINHHASVDHECMIGNGTHIAPGAILCGCVTAGENAFVGAGSVVLPGIKIGAGAIIGAGSVVTRNIEPGTKVAGNPARLI